MKQKKKQIRKNVDKVNDVMIYGSFFLTILNVIKSYFK